MSYKHIVTLLIVSLLVAACGGSAATTAPQGPAATQAPAASGQTIVGLITKTETNPFFVKMKEGAQAKARRMGVKLMTGAGAKDGDNEGQVTAIENMVNAGAKGILITPSDTKAIVPSIKKARDAGVLVIALDTATEPQDAVGCAVRDQQLQGRPVDRPVGQGRHEGQEAGHRHPRPAARHHRWRR